MDSNPFARFYRTLAACDTFEDLPTIGSGASSISRDPDFGREFIIRRENKLLFGTDYLFEDHGIPQFELFDGLDLPDDVQAQ